MATDTSDELAALERRGEYEDLISNLRERVRADRRTLTDSWVKGWCGRRWRDVFLTEACADESALSAATTRVGIPGTDISIKRGGDDRPERRRIAERFLHGDGVEDWRLELPSAQSGPFESATLVVCPGLIGSMLPLRAFQASLPALADREGWRMISADAHPMRSCAANVADLAAAIEHGRGLDHDCRPITDGAQSPGDVFLIGYSKGACDALTLLAERPELAGRIKALYSWGGAIGGSYLADDIYETVKDLRFPRGALGDRVKAVMRTLFPLVRMDAVSERLDEFDIPGAVRDLTTTARAEFNAEHAGAIDALDVPIFNIVGTTSPLEVPLFQVQGAMEIGRRDPLHDMQVTHSQARWATPMGTDLAELHAHHWDMSYDPFPLHTRLGSPNLDHQFPRTAALSAIVKLTAELGLIDP